MPTSLVKILAVIAGAVLTVNGITIAVNTMIEGAKTAVNGANAHQLATALEVYYLDNQAYPNVAGGQALIDTLYEKGLLKTRPADPTAVNYTVKDNGQDYSLTIADQSNETFTIPDNVDTGQEPSP